MTSLSYTSSLLGAFSSPFSSLPPRHPVCGASSLERASDLREAVAESKEAAAAAVRSSEEIPRPAEERKDGRKEGRRSEFIRVERRRNKEKQKWPAHSQLCFFFEDSFSAEKKDPFSVMAELTPIQKRRGRPEAVRATL